MRKEQKHKILCDTNFLIDIFRFRVELPENKDLYVTESVFQELRFLASTRKKESKFAKLALEQIENKRIKILSKIKNKADEDLIEYAKKGFIVATNDRTLRKRLKSLGFKTIYLRARKQIAVG